MTDLITYRLADRTDLSAVDGLLAHSYPRLLAPDYPPSVLVTALPLISRARPELLASGSYWLAQDDRGAVVGAGGWTASSPVAGDAVPAVGHVRHLVTHAGHVRQGIGRALMERVTRQAREAGMARLDCLSTRTAVPFYSAVGFRVLGPVDVPLRPGIVFPAIRMLRDL